MLIFKILNKLQRDNFIFCEYADYQDIQDRNNLTAKIVLMYCFSLSHLIFFFIRFIKKNIFI